MDLDSYNDTDQLGMFSLFLKNTADVPLVVLCYFGCSFVWVAFLFAGEWLISPQLHKSTFLLSGKLQTNILSTYVYCPRFLSVWCLFTLSVLWNAEVCFQPLSSLIWKGLGTCDAFLRVVHTLWPIQTLYVCRQWA